MINQPPEHSQVVVYAARLVRTIARSNPNVPAGVRVLSQLDELGASTVTELAAADRTSQPTMSAAVNALEHKGLVARSRNPQDARSALLSLTDAGRAELARVRVGHAEAVGRLVEAHGVSAADLETTVRVLRTLITPTEDPTEETEQ